MKDLISRFRANIITNGMSAFEEEKWDEISIGSLRFQVSSAKFCYSSPKGCQRRLTSNEARMVAGGNPSWSLTLTLQTSAGGYVMSAFWDARWNASSLIPREAGSSQFPVRKRDHVLSR